MMGRKLPNPDPTGERPVPPPPPPPPNRVVSPSEKPAGMDPECVELCEALNMLPGIRTSSSCCGHGREDYCIFFDANSLEALPPLLYYFAGCHCGFYDWKIIAKTDCGMSPAYFYIEGPRGEDAYKQALVITGLIREYVDGLESKETVLNPWRWTKVSEGLPADGMEVLVRCASKAKYLVEYDRGIWSDEDGMPISGVTQWAELPEYEETS